MNLANLHPLLVHLPIGIIIIGFLMELRQLKRPDKMGRETMLFILGMAALFSILSVITGWFLGDGGNYDTAMLNRHKWLGIAFTATAIALFFIKKSGKPWAKRSYLPLFAIATVLLTLTGHFGGNMTHGEGFLFADSSTEPVVIEDIEAAEVYAHIIHPILESKCVSCHNSNKIKGGLQLTTPNELMAGGDSGGLFDTIEDFNSNLLMHRVHLPLEDKEHMPPKGKPQLTDDEVLLLHWWLKNQNCFGCKVADLEADDRIENILASLETDNSTRGKLARELDFVDSGTFEKLAQNRISAQQLSEENPLVIINFSRRKDLGAMDFKLLKKIDDNVVEMNLAHTNFNDTLAKHLKTFKNLTKLQLQGTAITEKSTAQLKKLKHLESLNLFGLPISEDVIVSMEVLPSLKDIYLEPNGISFEKYELLAQNSIVVHGQDIEEKFKASQLNPPVILAEGEIFNDSLLIEINSVFDDALTFYSYVDSSGDTISKKYQEPFYIKNPITLMAHSEKEGWGISEPAKAIFIKTGAKISSASFAKPPHERYGARGATTLIDKKRGTTNFVDGQWIGYEASHLQSTLTLEESTKIGQVSIGHLSAPTNWIFSPIGYKIWGATDGTNYKHLKTVTLPPNPPSNLVERQLVNIEFQETELLSVRVQVISQLKNPDWHQVPGGKSFIFIDEIVLN